MQAQHERAGRTRDPRLDFFRGAALFIIFIAHGRGNALWHWIPARFGLSDAAHLFVFCSGYAAAIAFGGTFDRHGALAGTARIGLRCAQLYLAHLCLVLATAALAVLASGTETDYVAVIGVERLLDAPRAAVPELLALAYLPPLLDILPLYIVLLALVPTAMLLARLHPLVPPACSVALYATTTLWGLDLPADVGNGRPWFFDPFAWQLLFFTGFSLRRGWLEPPRPSAALTALCVGFVVASFVITRPAIYGATPFLTQAYDWIQAHSDKTRLDLLAYAHFLATAWLAVRFLAGREHLLLGAAARLICRCGRQALSVFVSGLLAAQVAGLVFDRLGTGLGPQLVVNGAGAAVLVATAYAATWLKAPPWKEAAASRDVQRPARPPVPYSDATVTSSQRYRFSALTNVATAGEKRRPAM